MHARSLIVRQRDGLDGAQKLDRNGCLRKQSHSWQSLAFDFVVPFLHTFTSIRHLYLMSLYLDESHVEALFSLAQMTALSIAYCSLALPDMRPSSPDCQFQLEKLTIRDVHCVPNLEPLLLAAITPRLHQLAIQAPFSEVYGALERLGPLPHVVSLYVWLDGADDPISTLLPIFPNVASLHSGVSLPPSLLDRPARFPLPPNAFPRLESFATWDAHDLSSIWDVRPLRELKLRVQNDQAADLMALLPRHSAALQALVSLDISVELLSSASACALLHDIVSRCSGLEQLRIQISWEPARAFLNEAQPPPSLRSFCVHISDSDASYQDDEDDEVPEILNAARALLRRMGASSSAQASNSESSRSGPTPFEYLRIHGGYCGLEFVYDRDVFGSLPRSSHAAGEQYVYRTGALVAKGSTQGRNMVLRW